MTSAPRSTHAPIAENTLASPSPSPSAKTTSPQRSKRLYQSQSSPLSQVTNPVTDPVTVLVREHLTSASATRDIAPTYPLAFTASHCPTQKPIKRGNGYGTVPPEVLQLSLLKTALDSFFDSILVIHADGRILHANGQANRLFANALPQTLTPSPVKTYGRSLGTRMAHPLQPLMDEIWRVATAMRGSQTEFPEQDIVIDSEVAWDGEAFRLRVRWMDLTIQHQPCLLVTIEDLQQTAVNQVNVDRWKYNLTPREVEVWRLKRQGYSYKAIATTLYVSENTVKKHLKNIHVKRREKDSPNIL